MPEKKENIIRVSIDPNAPLPMTEEQNARMEALAKMPDSEIDYSDIPPVTDFTGWQRVGKRQHMYVDNDIVAWLSSQDRDYQKVANDILRQAMLAATSNHA